MYTLVKVRDLTLIIEKLMNHAKIQEFTFFKQIKQIGIEPIISPANYLLSYRNILRYCNIFIK